MYEKRMKNTPSYYVLHVTVPGYESIYIIKHTYTSAQKQNKFGRKNMAQIHIL